VESKTLTKQSIIWDTIPDILPLDIESIKSTILKGAAFKKRQSEKKWDYKYNYYDLENDKYITWVHDYIRDHYNEQYHKTLILIKTAGIVQQEREGINTHNHTWEYDYEKTPDISCLYCVAMGEKPTYVTFEYQGGRVRHGRWKVPMAPRKLIMFNSEIPHYLTQNANDDPTINLSFQFHLV
jgi:hypothetical protein